MRRQGFVTTFSGFYGFRLLTGPRYCARMQVPTYQADPLTPACDCGCILGILWFQDFLTGPRGLRMRAGAHVPGGPADASAQL